VNKQEIFNKVWQRFVVEKAPKASDGSACIYGKPGDELRCAIGMFDAEGRLATSRVSVCTIAKRREGHDVLRTIFGDDYDISFLTDIQHSHDASRLGDRFAEDVERALRRDAVHYGLTVPQ
jgi:hypothetical protein